MTMPGGDGIGIKNLEKALARWTAPSVDVGLATGGTNTTLNDTRKSWVTNKWVGGRIEIMKANGQAYSRDISANIDTQITFAALPGGVVVAAGDLYSVRFDLTINVQAKFLRWGRDVEPVWVHAAEVTAPGAGTALVTQAVGAGKLGYIYGFFIACQEGNDFLINWLSGGAPRSLREVFGGGGTVEYVASLARNEGLPADAGSNITITNVNAGGAGRIYQARLLYAEV